MNAIPIICLNSLGGLDLVYSPELVDKSLILCERIPNELTGTIDFYNMDKRSLIFRTSPLEKSRLVLQLGSADPDLALKAQAKLYEDVAAFDLNCGCPKPFSTKGGMGSALLTKPDLLKSILCALVSGAKGKPVSCKLRIIEPVEPDLCLLKSMEETAKLAAELVRETGISGLALHCRTVSQRKTGPGHWTAFKSVVDALPPGFPFIANGYIRNLEEARKIQRDYGASSVMIACAAMENASVFREQGLLASEVVAKEFFKLCLENDIPFPSAKFGITSILCDRKNAIDKSVLAAKNYLSMSEALNMKDCLDERINFINEQVKLKGRSNLGILYVLDSVNRDLIDYEQEGQAAIA